MVSQSLVYNHCVPGSGEQKVVRTSVVPICLSTPWLEFYLPEHSPSQGVNSCQQGMGGQVRSLFFTVSVAGADSCLRFFSVWETVF